MKVIEKKNDLKTDVFKQDVDGFLTYFDTKSKSLKPASWIYDKTNGGYPPRNHCICFSGAAGSGKTTSLLSMFFSTKSHSRMYAKLFDKVLTCIPETTRKSLGEHPITKLPPDQVFDELNEEFLQHVIDETDTLSLEGKDTLIVIDDAASRLKGSKKIIDLLTYLICSHRHRRLTIVLAVQDLVQLPLPLRENLSAVAVFKQQNQKRGRIFWEEYMSDVVSFPEYIQLCAHVFQRKGDYLYINLQSAPKRFFRCYNELFISGSMCNDKEEA